MCDTEHTTCTCCGQLVRWSDLRWDGTQEVPAGVRGEAPYWLEYRSHSPGCGSTLGRERAWDDADAQRDADATPAMLRARRQVRGAA